MFDTTLVGPTLYTTTTYGAWIDTGDGTALTGQWLRYVLTNVIGIPNIKLCVQTSPDAVSACENTAYDGSGTGSPLVNSVGAYELLFQSRNRYWRWGIIFYANDPSDTGPGSGNSSSSSGQSNQSSSSSGGSAAIVATVGLVPTSMG